MIRSLSQTFRRMTEAKPLSRFTNVLAFTIVASFLYVFMEWLFIATMPSFLGASNGLEKAEILFVSGLFISVTSAAFVLVLSGARMLASRLFGNIFLDLDLLAPAFILTVLAMLLVDNFTYTVFNFGISSTSGVVRGLYGVVFIGTFAYLFIKVRAHIAFVTNPQKGATARAWYAKSASFLLLISALFFAGNYARSGSENGSSLAAGNRPNIILLCSDGLNATHMSVYGYERETTPVLEQLAKRSLFLENAYPNGMTSSGSEISVLTGKLPIQTRVISPPDIFTGMAAFQHLPGLLRKEGYYSVQIGAEHYVDANIWNIQDGFDLVNGRSYHENTVLKFLRRNGYESTAYFLSRLLERASERILHITLIKRMANPYDLVTQPAVSNYQYDGHRVAELLSILDSAREPVFAHVHLMGTHSNSGMFDPRVRLYSQGQVQTEPYMVDFYDDAILDFDAYVGEILGFLKDNNKLENTLLVIYTDHNSQYTSYERTPLMIYFPGAQYAGRIRENAQNLDIAPTILSYLGMPEPDWMTGESLIDGPLPDDRLIFSYRAAYGIQKEDGLFYIDYNKVKPPFYQFGQVGVIDCNRWYLLSYLDLQLRSGVSEGHTARCDEADVRTPDEIVRGIIDQMKENGFDTSTIEAKFKITSSSPSQ